MKAFEKWFNDKFPNGNMAKGAREEAWRATLEWFKTQIPDTWDVSTGEVLGILEKELDDSNTKS